MGIRKILAQMLVTSLFKKHRILTQIAGHAMDVIKVLPPFFGAPPCPLDLCV